MTSPFSVLLTRITTRARLWLPIIVSTLLAIALIAESSGALAFAQGEQNQQAQEDAEAEEQERLDITDTADARQFAVDMLDSNFPASRDAAAAALAGSEDDFNAYKDGGMETAQNQDLRQILVTVSAISGPKVQDKVAELLEANDGAGDTEAIAEFIDSGWQELQVQDDRATAWQAAEAPRGTALKRAADAALQDNSADALAEFAATGADTARTHDKRREVYELSTSELPSVAAGASEALQVNTDTVIDTFLRYGQFVAAAQDAEKMDITELVSMSVDEASRAAEANSLAVAEADRAARAAENARVATERARDEAKAAGDAQGRAANAASAAGRLAQQSAAVADQAVAASQEARIALQQTADALNRAASAAGRAQAAASAAASAASSAARDASTAAGARIAAEQARNAAQAAEDSARAFAHADSALASAGTAGAAANSAASNADAAAAAASDAASVAGESEAAAAEARAGAARARAAAGRAKAAANEVDRIVGEIRGLVDQARKAAEEATRHARASAEAAEEAAREAGNADYAAQKSGVHAADAAAAAQASRDNMDLAEAIAETAAAAADERRSGERDYLVGQAEEARAVQDAQDAAEEDEKQRTEELTTRMEELMDDLNLGDSDDADTANRDAATARATDIRELAVIAAQVGTPTIAGAARVALSGGTTDDYVEFAFNGYSYALEADAIAVAQQLWESDPDETIRATAEDIVEAYPDMAHEFVTEELPELRIPGLKQEAWNLREAAGEKTMAAADTALRANTFEALDEFVNGGFERAREQDQLIEAYHLAEQGGPEVSAAAEAAVKGDRDGLAEFIQIEQFRRQMMDDQRESHDQQINNLLEVGNAAAENASESAASAQAAHEQALGSAQRANEYADQAAQWAGQAEQSARMAAEHVASAEASLEFAKQQQTRAHEAAASAEADAAQAATEAFTAAHTLRAYEQEQLQAAEQAGYGENEKSSVLDSIRDVVGKETLDIILDIIGVKDILDCFGGSLSSCLWAAVGALPFGKILKIGKITTAVRQLLGKADKIFDAVRHRARDTGRRLQDRLTCGPSRASVSVLASCPQIPAGVDVVNGRYPINARYAGQKYPLTESMAKKYPEGVSFSKRGYPNFDAYSRNFEDFPDGKVKIDPGRTRGADFRQADALTGYSPKKRREEGLVWHHHEETNTMILIPRDIHKEVKHTGGYALWGGGNNPNFETKPGR